MKLVPFTYLNRITPEHNYRESPKMFDDVSVSIESLRKKTSFHVMKVFGSIKILTHIKFNLNIFINYYLTRTALPEP